jgi:hypothetical protein
MDWTQIADALKAWFLAGTGLDLVVLENEERPFVEPAWGYLVIDDAQSVGTDSTYLVDRPGAEPGAPLVPMVSGLRIFTVHVYVESFSQRPEDFAVKHLERLRGALRFPRLMKMIREVGLALVDVSPTVVSDYAVDERVISRASFDVRFNAAFNLIDEADQEAGDYIERIELTSHVENVDGSELPQALQLHEEAIPPDPDPVPEPDPEEPEP